MAVAFHKCSGQVISTGVGGLAKIGQCPSRGTIKQDNRWWCEKHATKAHSTTLAEVRK